MKLDTTKLKDALLWIMRPVTSQLPLFVISFLIIAANPLYCGFKLLPRVLHGIWPEGLTLVLIYLSISLLIAYLIALIVQVTHKKWVKFLIYSLLVLIFGVYCFVQLNFHSIMTPTIMMAMTETNTNETAEFFEQFAFSWQSIATYAALALTIFIIVFFERRHRKKIERNGTRHIPMLVLAFLLGILVWGITNTRHHYELASANFLSELEESQMFSHNTYAMDIVTDWLYCLKAVESSENEVDRSLTKTLAALKESSTTQVDSLTVILVIGESYIKSHASLYGYKLKTTPHMQELEQSGNLVAFTDCISPYNTTNISLKNTLSTNSIGDNEKWYNTPYWPAIVARAGFVTTFWDNQYSFSPLAGGGSLEALLYNDKIASSIYVARNKKAYDYDGELLDDYFKQVKKIGLESKPLCLAMFHLMGQHVAPSKRYPEQFNVFKFDNPAYSQWLEDQAQYRAEYDNATLYNDSVIYSIAQHYANKCAVMIYFSDHGEEAYDFRSSFGRQNDPIKTKEILHYQNDVPLIVWYSNKYANTFPEVVERIQKATKRPMMLDLLGYMIFDLARIDTKLYRSNLDVLSANYCCPPRITYNNVDYDKICK